MAAALGIHSLRRPQNLEERSSKFNFTRNHRGAVWLLVAKPHSRILTVDGEEKQPSRSCAPLVVIRVGIVSMAIGGASSVVESSKGHVVGEPGKSQKDDLSLALLKLSLLLLIIELSVLAFALVKLHDLQAEVAAIKTGSQAGSGSECHQNSCNNQKENEWRTAHCDSNQGIRGSDTFFSSCNDVLRQLPAAPSGHYLVKGTYGYPVPVYCDMTRNCRGVSGGWRRIVLWNMSEPGTTCLSGLTHIEDSSSCIQNNEESDCASIKFENLGIPYTSVCGRINAFHSDSLDAFMKYTDIRHGNLTVEHNYVDGVSLTHGPAGERVHVWSFAATVCQYGSQDKPDFVKDHFSSDHGNLTDLLWDDNQCPGTPCGKSSWFFRNLTEGTYSDLEIRMCRDQGRHDEDVLLTYVEIYVQ